MVATATRAVRDELLNAKRHEAACTEDGAAGKEQQMPFCTSMASDGPSEHGGQALLEAQRVLDLASAEQVFRAGAQPSGPSPVHPTVEKEEKEEFVRA